MTKFFDFFLHFATSNFPFLTPHYQEGSSHGTGGDDAVGVDKGCETVAVGVVQHVGDTTGKGDSPQFIQALLHGPQARECDCRSGR